MLPDVLPLLIIHSALALDLLPITSLLPVLSNSTIGAKKTSTNLSVGPEIWRIAGDCIGDSRRPKSCFNAFEQTSLNTHLQRFAVRKKVGSSAPATTV